MEIHAVQPEHAVQEAEYLRLLGYPRGHQPGDRVRELMAWARDWYSRHGRPWAYLREAALRNEGATLQLDQVEFASLRLQEHFRHHDVRGAILVAVSAGAECEAHAHELWEQGRPDEYFFLEMFGSAVVEDLVARTSGRICDLAGHRGLMAVPHYSPGYAGWDVAEQNKLFSLIERGVQGSLPGPIEVLSSGMLRPKKSLLAISGLAPKSAHAAAAATAAPCVQCSFSPCRYRRAPYRHGADSVSDRTAGQPQTVPAVPRYSVNARALRKWASERVMVMPQPDGTIEAVFRFDGTTCAHRPLAFDYRVRLGGAEQGYPIVESGCAPASDDDGHRYTCSFLSDGAAHLQEIASDQPLLGRPIEEVFAWTRVSAPTGCHCSAESRAHKWGLALEVIHFALVQARTPQPVS
jgi:hypothetical protein